MTQTPPSPSVKGWCPGAYRPMMSGDGLVVRVRPVLARLTRDQVFGLCDTALAFGSGLIDLTSRSNLQIRGVTEGNHQAVLDRLQDIGLLPDDPILEGRRNILIAPMLSKGDNTTRLATDLMARLGDLPELPAKMGYAIDTDIAPQFTQNSADFRFERTATGDLILRADGMSRGRAVTVDTAIDALIEMADWFVATGGRENRRMARHTMLTTLPADWQAVLPAAPAQPLKPGQTALGAVFGVAFGQIEATALKTLMTATAAKALRVTPWRLFLMEGAEMAETAAFITTATDPLLTTDACPGAPLCAIATVETREIARSLAGQFTGPLHVSGCAKGCARPRACATTLVGRDGAFDLVRNGTPWDQPTETDLTPDSLVKALGTH
ncbi:cobalamin biosynthesis protein CobG [Shimia sp. Alg240-R146]|uniref:cobalamin biosynthesis protein CobG n=1 Tax=Shimia sp. Alg240-R146 TaxID=2993449 RepID=UPI0022DF3623|nr:cobalamin biosynthesis protein CobG [Shimia sp. Alg240-R146]